MEKNQDQEKMRSLMIDHIDGKLTDELSKYVEGHIDKNEDARKEYDQLREVMMLVDQEEELETRPEWKNEFLEMLESEKQIALEKKGEVITMTFDKGFVFKVAAAMALLVIGFATARLIEQDQSEITALRLELLETKELVLLSMMKGKSPSERIKGVMASYEMDDQNIKILDVLIRTMNTDENINVRLASVEALGRFADNEKVKEALISALVTQHYPAVQIRLIDILVEIGDNSAVDLMQKLADDEKIVPYVRDEAQMGVFKLM